MQSDWLGAATAGSIPIFSPPLSLSKRQKHFPTQNVYFQSKYSLNVHAFAFLSIKKKKK